MNCSSSSFESFPSTTSCCTMAEFKDAGSPPPIEFLCPLLRLGWAEWACCAGNWRLGASSSRSGSLPPLDRAADSNWAWLGSRSGDFTTGGGSRSALFEFASPAGGTLEQPGARAGVAAALISSPVSLLSGSMAAPTESEGEQIPLEEESLMSSSLSSCARRCVKEGYARREIMQDFCNYIERILASRCAHYEI